MSQVQNLQKCFSRKDLTVRCLHALKNALANCLAIKSTVPQRRTFHTEPLAAYTLPNDRHEHVRLNEQSKGIVSMMNDRPFHPTLVHPRRILDVGCGTGLMTMLLARTFPEAHVVGVDLSDVPPMKGLPSNVTFIKGDIHTLAQHSPELQAETFDYIFARCLEAGETDWAGLISALKALLRTGGWLEMQEPDFLYRDSVTGEPVSTNWPWHRACTAGIMSRGLDMVVGAKLGQYLCDAGLQNLYTEKWAYWSTAKFWSAWPNSTRMGIYQQQHFNKFLDFMIDRFASSAQSEGTVRAWKKQAVADVTGASSGTEPRFQWFHAAWAQNVD